MHLPRLTYGEIHTHMMDLWGDFPYGETPHKGYCFKRVRVPLWGVCTSQLKSPRKVRIRQMHTHCVHLLCALLKSLSYGAATCRCTHLVRKTYNVTSCYVYGSEYPCGEFARHSSNLPIRGEYDKCTHHVSVNTALVSDAVCT